MNHTPTFTILCRSRLAPAAQSPAPRPTLWVCLLLAAAALSPPPLCAFAQPTFTIAVLPDTQFYCANSSGNNAPFFAAQTGWIVSHAPQWNIVFSTQLGDVVNTAGPVGAPSAEWNVAVPAMNILRNSPVPHSILAGNHDWTSSAGTGSLEHYRPRFGDTSTFFAGQPWFLGFDQRGVNTAQRFSTPIGDFLHIALEWNAASPVQSSDRPGAPADGIAWAQSIIDAHPSLPTIISTHNNINTSGVRDAAGHLLFLRLVAPNNQVFMVLNGHYSSSAVTERLFTSINNFGRPVYEMLTDYQARSRGGDGWMRLLVFDPANNTIRARTYTPIPDATGGLPAGPEFNNIGRIETDADSQFDLPLDFSTRFVPPPPPPPPPPAPIAATPFALKQFSNGYSGTLDTEVRRNLPTTNFAAQGFLHIDTNEGGTALQWPSHGLLRFSSLFGPGPNQIPPDRAVLNATLRLYVHPERSNSGGSGFSLHRMLVPWSGATTWNSTELLLRGAGIGVSPDSGLPTGFDTRWYEPGSNGFEALASPDATAGADAAAVAIPQGTRLELDVTRSLRAFHDGAPNFGWLLQSLPNTTDAVRVESSESELPGANYPELVITLSRDPAINTIFTQGIDTWISQANPTSSNPAAPSLTVDGGTDNSNPGSADSQALLRFSGIFGNGAEQVRPGSQIASATLSLNFNSAVQFYDGSGFTLHRMLADWSPASTWNTLGGGVRADGVVAAINPDDRAGYQRVASPWDNPYVQSGSYLLDVTDSLRRWSATGGNDANFGWALLPLPNGTNAVIFDSFDANLPSSVRPQLVVRYVPSCPADLTGDGLVTSQDLFEFLGAFFAQTLIADFDADGVINSQDFFAYLAAFFDDCR